MTTGTILILFFLVTLCFTLRWLSGSWRKALVSMAFAPAFLAVVAPLVYFIFALLLSELHSQLSAAGMPLSSGSLELVSGVLTGMSLLGLTAIYGINALRPRTPRARIAIAGSPLL